ncbi:MAG: glycosyltransferase [Treponema sp.]|jgi:glycosyltransferase involved in cell wall biosynthesis|nr:glycosyltransferase [Treponema sp.]
MTVVHVLEPFVSGVCAAVISITEQLPDVKHIVVHGSRALVDTVENVRARFPRQTEFVEWKSAGREISLSRDLKALKELIAILQPYEDADAVIHLHSSKAGFLGRVACAMLGIPRVIYTPHCASFIRADIGFLKRHFFRLLERVGGAFGGKVVGCGKSEALLYSRLGRGASWVSNGVRISSASSKVPEARLVSFSGLISVQKDPALFNELALAFAGQPFCWIGDGPLQEKLSAENITVTGWADVSTVNAWLDKTQIYLSASAWEGLPFGALEAMNRSCALLLRDVPGNRDLVVPGENGYVFGDKEEGIALLKAMLEDPEKTAAMGKKSREIVERDYSVGKMGEGYRSVYAAIREGKELEPWV